MGIVDDAVRAARMARIEGLLALLSEKYGVTRDEIMGRGRTAIVTRARRELMLELWRSGVPLIEIGRMLDRDHTTVLYALRRVLGEHAYVEQMRAHKSSESLNLSGPVRVRVAS